MCVSGCVCTLPLPSHPQYKHSTQLIEFDPILIIGMKIYPYIPLSVYLYLSNLPTLVPSWSGFRTSQTTLDQGIWCPPTGAVGAFSPQGGCSVFISCRVRQHGLLIFLLYQYILFVGFLLLIEGTVGLSWWHLGNTACCELSQRVISSCSWPHQPVYETIS